MGRGCVGGQPAKQIVSVRVTDEEMRVLQELARAREVNISTLLRQSLTREIEETQLRPLRSGQ